MPVGYLGLGANLDDPPATFVRALTQLSDAGITIKQVSPLYRTRPVGPQDQPDFINAVACVETDLDAHALLQQLLATETQLGRERKRHWGERNIDLDLLCLGDAQVNDDALTLPHPRISERAFVLVPFADIAPALVLPGQADTINTLRQQCNDDGVCYHGTLDWSSAGDRKA